jgi:hypothetical protein
METSAREQLTADFQVRAMRAGMSPVLSVEAHPDSVPSTGTLGPR